MPTDLEKTARKAYVEQVNLALKVRKEKLNTAKSQGFAKCGCVSFSLWWHGFDKKDLRDETPQPAPRP
ncbi:MAG: hypothetical protein P4M12_12835 [Gammaproteobacteria bacterium]|nr:hypothetical protein [Gammaproteobacteria bacterium]